MTNVDTSYAFVQKFQYKDCSQSKPVVHMTKISNNFQMIIQNIGTQISASTRLALLLQHTLETATTAFIQLIPNA